MTKLRIYTNKFEKNVIWQCAFYKTNVQWFKITKLLFKVCRQKGNNTTHQLVSIFLFELSAVVELCNHLNSVLSCDVYTSDSILLLSKQVCDKKGDNKIIDNNLTSWIMKSNIKMCMLLYLIGHVVTANRHILVLVFNNSIYRIKVIQLHPQTFWPSINIFINIKKKSCGIYQNILVKTLIFIIKINKNRLRILSKFKW